MAAKMQLTYFLLIICVIGSIECGLRHKRDDEPEKKEEEPTTTPAPKVSTESSGGGTGGKYPFIPKDIQDWFGGFGGFGDKFPGGGPNKWFEQAGSMGGGNKWMEDASSFFSKAPWAKKEK